MPQAPHAQPVAQRAGRCDAVGGPVRPCRDPGVAHVGLPVGRLQGGIDHPRVGPGAHHREGPVGEAGGADPDELGQRPVGDGLVARDLRGAVAGDEVGRVRRCVAFVEQVQVGIRCHRVVLVGDRGIHPRREHVGPAGMCSRGDITVGRRQVVESGRGSHSFQRGDVVRDGVRLIGGHQRSAARIAQQDNGVDALLLAQPAHPDTDVDQRVIEQEAAFESAETSVPPEEAEAAPSHVLGEIVLGEVDLIMRRDHRDGGPVSLGAVVEPLAGMPARPGPVRRRRVEPDEFAGDSRGSGHGSPDSRW